MKNIIWLLFLLITASHITSQNLIPNPGFEQCDKCVNNFMELGLGTGANNPVDWTAATYGTPDFYGTRPHSGLRHGGFFTGFPKFEYLANHFTDTLKRGETYQFSFWISLGPKNQNYSIDQIGVYIQQGPAIYMQAEPLKQLNPVYETPDGEYIDGTYRKYQFEYKACGGEDHFIVGKFRALSIGDTLFVGTKRPANPLTESIYYYVDDFEMIKIKDSVVVDLLPETLNICKGEIKTISINSPYNNEIILWSTGQTSSTITIPETNILTVEIFLNDFCNTILRDTSRIIITGTNDSIRILSPDVVCTGDTIKLTAICNQCFDFKWNTGEITQSIQITTAGTYSVSAKTLCKELNTSKTINSSSQKLDSLIYYPNIIVPQGEEANQKFKAFVADKANGKILSHHLVVYNRWGKKIFETNNINGEWAPSIDEPMETYMYVSEIEYQDCDAIRKKSYKGTVTLIR